MLLQNHNSRSKLCLFLLLLMAPPAAAVNSTNHAVPECCQRDHHGNPGFEKQQCLTWSPSYKWMQHLHCNMFCCGRWIIWNLVKILIFNMFNCCELVVEVCTNNGIGKSTFLTDSGWSTVLIWVAYSSYFKWLLQCVPLAAIISFTLALNGPS